MDPKRWVQIETLLHRVLECETQQRSKLLDEAGNGDPELRQEVESLLLYEDKANAHLLAAVRHGAEAARFPLVGEVISHYRILSGLGAGGMGVVYKAEDTKLDRLVALKFLPEELKRSQEALTRFEREARAAGALNHPNICTIHDIDEQDGRIYIVMEYLEGYALRELLVGTPGTFRNRRRAAASLSRPDPSGPLLDTDVLLDLGIQIADGLDAAHQKHIIHRDIKPANIFVTARGQAKILDFGLAKLTMFWTQESELWKNVLADDSQSSVARDVLNAWAEPRQLTTTGARMGTIGYMSPEQVRGDKLDNRTDLFSFGAVLYEMGTGRACFPGSASAGICAAILDRAPIAPSQLTPDLPSKLEEIILKALEKHCDLRYQTAAEIRGDLKRLKRDISSGKSLAMASASHLSQTEPSHVLSAKASAEREHKTAPGAVRPNRLIMAIAARALILGAVVLMAWWISGRSKSSPEFQERRLTANPQDSPVYSAAISPNGRYLGYSDREGIHLQNVRTGEKESIPLPPDIKRGQAFWELDSWYPDSTRFVARLMIPGKPSSLWSVPIVGGAPQELISDVNGDAAVSPDGSKIVFSRKKSILGAREIWLMGSYGESPHRLLAAAGQSRFGRIIWSPAPASNRIAYEVITQQDLELEHAIMTCDLNGVNQTTVVPNELAPGWNASSFIWIPPGRFLYRRAGTGRLRITTFFWNINDAYLSDGDLWELRVRPQDGVAKGESRRITPWSGLSMYDFSATTDGKILAYLRSNSHQSVFIGDLASHGKRLLKPHRLMMDEFFNTPFSWTADSRNIIILSHRIGTWGIYRQSLDGRVLREIMVSAALDADEPRLSPDGSWVVFSARPHDAPAGTPVDIYRAPIDGGAPQRLFEVRRFIVLYCTNRAANFCAYASHSADGQTMTITGFDPGGGRRWELPRIPIEPGADYHWSPSPDGSEMAVLRNDWDANQVWFIPLRGGATRKIPLPGFFNLGSLDWAADSKSVFVGAGQPSGAVLLRIGLNGSHEPIWRQPEATQIWAIASPDGRRLAIHSNTAEADAWMLSNF